MSSKVRRLDRSPLRCEELECRATPAQFGVPWTDSAHLTVSFVPDGTTIAGETSKLSSALDAQLPRAVWQEAILKAIQTWSDIANINVGLVSDNGADLGTTGANQGDSRFGDIRVAGLPMTAEAMAVSVPPATFITGTYAGDIVVNTAARFTSQSLYAVALHETGHAFGLPHSTDPKSVMYSHLNQNTLPAPSDVAAIKALYGARSPDANEGAKGNATLKLATRIKYSAVSGGYGGATPLVTYGDITAKTDVDVYFLKPMLGYTGTVTFRVETAGVSLLAPRVTLLDRLGRPISQATSFSNSGGTLTLTLPASLSNQLCYLKVESAPGATRAIGRYAIATTFDSRSQPTTISVESVLRGAYETLSPEDMEKLFLNAATVELADDANTEDSVAFATDIKPGVGLSTALHLQTTSSLSATGDIDWFRVKSPTSATRLPWVMTLSTRGIGLNPVNTKIELFDGALKPIPAQVIVNGNGAYTIQATGIAAKGNFFIRVSGPATSGNYVLDANFGTAAADLQTLAANTLPSAASVAKSSLYLAHTQLFSLGLTATGATGAVRMDIVNASGVSVFSLTAGVGETITGTSALLPPGEYVVRYSAVGTTGPVSFVVRGAGISDPVGPLRDSATLIPQYQAPQDPNKFLYPNGALTTAAYLWLISLIV